MEVKATKVSKPRRKKAAPGMTQVSLMDIRVEVNREKKEFGRAFVHLSTPAGDTKTLEYDDMIDGLKDGVKVLVLLLAGAANEDTHDAHLNDMLHRMDPKGNC